MHKIIYDLNTKLFSHLEVKDFSNPILRKDSRLRGQQLGKDIATSRKELSSIDNGIVSKGDKLQDTNLDKKIDYYMTRTSKSKSDFKSSLADLKEFKSSNPEYNKANEIRDNLSKLNNKVRILNENRQSKLDSNPKDTAYQQMLNIRSNASEKFIDKHANDTSMKRLGNIVSPIRKKNIGAAKDLYDKTAVKFNPSRYQ